MESDTVDLTAAQLKDANRVFKTLQNDPKLKKFRMPFARALYSLSELPPHPAVEKGISDSVENHRLAKKLAFLLGENRSGLPNTVQLDRNDSVERSVRSMCALALVRIPAHNNSLRDLMLKEQPELLKLSYGLLESPDPFEHITALNLFQHWSVDLSVLAKWVDMGLIERIVKLIMIHQQMRRSSPQFLLHAAAVLCNTSLIDSDSAHLRLCESGAVRLAAQVVRETVAFELLAQATKLLANVGLRGQRTKLRRSTPLDDSVSAEDLEKLGIPAVAVSGVADDDAAAAKKKKAKAKARAKAKKKKQQTSTDGVDAEQADNKAGDADDSGTPSDEKSKKETQSDIERDARRELADRLDATLYIHPDEEVMSYLGSFAVVLALQLHPDREIQLQGKRLLTVFPIGQQAQSGKRIDVDKLDIGDQQIFNLRANQLRQGFLDMQRMQEQQMARARGAMPAEMARRLANFAVTKDFASDAKEMPDVTDDGRRKCSRPACANYEQQGTAFAKCGQCKLTCYCSPSCQKSHWKQGHKAQCKQTAATA